MNKDNLEHFLEEAKKIKLQEHKKEAIGREVLRFMKSNPIAPGIKKRWDFFGAAGAQNWVAPRFSFNSLSRVLAVMLALVLVSGAVTVKADFALPGDLLYPVKLGVNEKVKRALAFSDQAKVSLDISLVQLRLQEVEELMVQHGSINNQEKLDNNFKIHTDRALAGIKKLRDNNEAGQETTMFSLESSLRAHAQVLKFLGGDNLKKSSIVEIVNEASSKIYDIRAEFNSKAGDKKHQSGTPEHTKELEDKVSAAENSISKIKKLLNDKKNKMGSEQSSQLQDNLDLAQQKITEGKDKLSKDGNDYQGLISSLQEAHIIAQESKDLLDAKNNLGVDISVKINENSGQDGKNVNVESTIDGD